MHSSTLFALNMGQRLAICLLSSTLSLASMQQTPAEMPAAADDLTASVMGRIVNSLTGEPVKGATVEMTCSTNYCQTETTTCLADGTFRFNRVTPGAYNFAAYAGGFVTAADSMAANVAIAAPASTLVLKLTPGATVSGRVLNAGGTPVLNASVQALTEMHTFGVRQLVQRSRTTTDASGAYVIEGLASGQYYILSRLEHGTGDATLAPSYSPSSATSDQTSLLLVQYGRTYSDINIYMPAAVSHRVDGTISDVGELGPKPEIRLEPQNYLESKVLGRQGKVSANGQFVITGVTPGRYVLLLKTTLPISNEISQRPGVPRIVARQDIEVGSTDVDGIILNPTSVAVWGRVSNDDGSAQGLGQARIYLRSIRGGTIKLVRSNPDGTFNLGPCDPVEYLAMIVPPPGSYVQSVQFDNHVADTRLLDLAGGSHQLKIVVRRDGAEVKSAIKIHGSSGNQTGTDTSSSAILIPETWSPDGWAERRLVAVTDSGFDFKDVAPGVYAVIAVHNTSELMRSAEDPEVVRMLQTLGEHIDVGPRDNKEISIPVAVDQ